VAGLAPLLEPAAVAKHCSPAKTAKR
jgi:hypothetical protein